MITDIVGRVRARNKSIFRGWWVVANCFIINVFGAGSFFYGFTTFFNPMIAEFGWSRMVMSGVFSLSRLEGGIEGPVVGWLIDRLGARRILLIGVGLAGLGFIALYLVNAAWSLYLIFGLMLSLGYNLGYNNATQAVVAKWFVKKRSRALAFLLAGNGVGGAIFVPLIAWLILQFDWRMAAVIVGIATLAIPLPMSLLVKNSPEEVGLLPDGDTEKQKETSAESKKVIEDVDFTVKEALKTPAFWVYSTAMMFRAMILSAIVVHEIPYLTDIGFAYETASIILGLTVLMSVPGRLIFGWLGDHFNKKMLTFLLCLLQAVGILIFINARTTSMLYLFILIYGLGYGGIIPLTIALRADMFGRRKYATIAGMVTPITTIGTVTAPILAGYLYDITKSYTLAFYIFTGLIALSGILFLLIPRATKKAAVIAAS